LQTQDGWISLTANTNAQVAAFFEAVGRPELFEDPRFCSVPARLAHVADWYAERAACVREHDTADLLRRFAAVDVPAMPCHSLESLIEDPHLTDVELIAFATHPTEGQVRTLRPTILHDGATADAGQAAVPIGYDTQAVLEEFGLKPNAVEALLSDKAAYQFAD
jgi:crotonobetainyl-CoA:carnitine CoA-transferase CaiB-like acyl-CoA transferase